MSEKERLVKDLRKAEKEAKGFFLWEQIAEFILSDRRKMLDEVYNVLSEFTQRQKINGISNAIQQREFMLANATIQKAKDKIHELRKG